MPEIKHTFTGGKMNKDLDERLIPNGQYSDAMNIQVSTSEGSDVGTVQNILGNKSLFKNYGEIIGKSAVCIGSIADEKNDTLYYLIWSSVGDFIFEYSNQTLGPIPVFVDKNKNVLKFDPTKPITGINIIDGMLFWTDSINEPRKINIERCKQGMVDFDQTKLINSSQSLLDPATAPEIEEKHITVIRKGPQASPDMRLFTSRDPNKIYTAVIKTSFDEQINGAYDGTGLNDDGTNSFTATSATDGRHDFNNIDDDEGNKFWVRIYTGLNSLGEEVDLNDATTGNGPLRAMTGWYSSGGLQSIVGTKVLLQAYDVDDAGDQTPPGLPLTNYTIKGHITNVSPSSGNTAPNPPWEDYHTIGIRITNIEGNPPIPKIGETLKYVIDLYDETEKLFEFKYPRFSYRYKFEDGEYSTFAPFTQVAFVPGAFDYHPRKGYNIGMTNKLIKVELLNLVTENTPRDVVAIDILFKDDASPSVYIVDTIKPDDYSDPGDDNLWNRILASSSDPSIPLVTFDIEKEAISSIVPSNQLLRPWDNVPTKALAQDVTGNRIVYANYHQNYDLTNQDGEKYVPSFSITNKSFFQYTPLNQTISSLDLLINPGSNVAANTFRSIKSLREYQLGVVFMDEYGRETPVISNASGTIKINKTDAKNSNRLNVQFNSDNYPQALTNFKFFIKETSSEYYNMAMDRWYVAGDGNIWLAFPSSDRNKIDIDTFLILKKGSDQDTLVEDAARYKVLAIESEAPDFIKTTKRKAVSITHGSSADLFGSVGSDGPFEGLTSFKMNYTPFFRTSGQNLADVEEELWIEFSKVGQDLVSERYKINSITNSYVDTSVAPDATAAYSIELDQPLGTDVNFITNDPGGTNSNVIENGAVVNVYKYKVENLERFDGRFFVKVLMDEVFLNNIETTTIGGGFRISDSKRVYSMDNKLIKKHTSNLDRFLTNGQGNTRTNYPFRSTWLPQLHSEPGNWNGPKPNNSNTLYGYYSVDEFTAFAAYFRKYREIEYKSYSNQHYGVKQTDKQWATLPPYPSWSDIDSTLNGKCRALIHLSNGSVNGTNGDGTPHIEYKGRGWKDTRDWWKEYGYNTTEFNTGLRVQGILNGKTRGLTSAWGTAEENWQQNGAGQHGKFYWEYQAHSSDYDSVRDNEVWFIDSGPYTGVSRSNLPDNTLEFGNSDSSMRNKNVHGLNLFQGTNNGYNSTSNEWRMDLGFGGIKSPSIDTNVWNQKQDQVGFWNVGNWNQLSGSTQNLSYSGDITNFVSKLNTGSRFRWKEDPNQTIYTVNGSPITANLLRHSDGPYLNGNSAHNGSQHYSRAHIGGATGMDISLRSMAEQLSFNMTKFWRLNKISPKLEWNPLDAGVIPNTGMKLTSCDETGLVTGGGVTVTGINSKTFDLTIFVKDITVVQSNGIKRTLHEGMALRNWVDVNGDAVDANDPYVVREITPIDLDLNTGRYELKLGGYTQPLLQAEHDFLGNNKPRLGATVEETRFVQVGMNGYSPNSEFNINTIAKPKTDGSGHMKNKWGAIGAVGYTLEFVEEKQPVEVLSENPAIWETEPKETTALDVYYEASGSIPAIIDDNTIEEAFPIGTKFMEGSFIFTVIGYRNNRLIVSGSVFPSVNSDVEFFRPDDLIIQADIIFSQDVNGNNNNVPPFTVGVQQNLVESNFTLPWHNCYSFQNGVESNRIRDNFNLPYISNGVKASTTLEQEYKEEHRKYGLIYSGIYNSTSGINNLNQFIAAEKITKDVNPIYGSIQKLYSRDSDVVALCEDKILKIHANKDALFNADGNSNVTASSNVLGQTIPFSGEYGISKNPESFASENYRAYFTDRVRGAAMRLSKDGLTPISDAGMKDWFRDNLKLNNTAFGSYDDKKDEYNVTLSNNITVTVNALGASKFVGIPPLLGTANIETVTYIANLIAVGDSLALQGAQGAVVISKQNLGGGRWRITLDQTTDENAYGNLNYLSINNQGVPEGPYWKAFLQIKDQLGQTVSYREDVKGWVSFKSFTPENAISMANEYYSIMDGELWLHHNETVDRNTFYDAYTNSSVEVVLNDEPSSIKTFNTINYEGSQSKVDKFVIEQKSLDFQPPTTYNNQAIYNLLPKQGWYVETVYTDKEEGYIKEFIEKEGKWFNSINRRIDVNLQSADTGDFTFQGIGTPTGLVTFNNKLQVYQLSFNINNLNSSLQVGDMVYASPTSQQDLAVDFEGQVGKNRIIGVLLRITNPSAGQPFFILDIDDSGGHIPQAGDFIMFSKHSQTNGDINGYYAKANFTNDSREKAELFAVSSEVIINSK